MTRARTLKTGVIDNPATMAREYYSDGQLRAHATAALLQSAGFRGGHWFPMELNVGPWTAGKVWWST